MHAIQSRKSKLEAYFSRAQSKALDDQTKADLAKHGAVLICGFVERSVEIVIMERLSYRAHPRVTNFVKGHFKRGTNYDCEPICQLLERFDLEWSRNLRAFLQDNDDVVDAMTSAYTIRNSVAHGGDGGGGLNVVMQYFESAKRLVDALIEATRT